MEQTPHTTEPYDFRRYDRIWQRVAPALEPYPEGSPPPGAQTTALESRLPGAEENPCCMGTAAAELLEVLTGYIEEELDDQRYYQALQHCAPPWAKGTLQRIGEEEGRHAKRLMAVHYLITGKCYSPAIPCGRIRVEGWCPALRRRYHAEACGGLNYARTADETTDICLRKLLMELSREEYRHAEMISHLLERSISC